MRRATACTKGEAECPVRSAGEPHRLSDDQAVQRFLSPEAVQAGAARELRVLRSRILPARRAAELEPDLWSQRLLPISVRGPEGSGAGINSGPAECHGGGRAGILPHRLEGVWRRAQPGPA